MKRLLLGTSVAAAMLITASAAFAGGINLAWATCAQDGGLQNKAFACNLNTGSNVLSSSFVLDADLADVSGNETVFDFLTTSDPLPAWWDMRNVGTCRQNSLSVGFAFADNLCMDWSLGQGAGGIGAYTVDAGPQGWTIDPSVTTRHRRLKTASAVPNTALGQLVAAQEYYSTNVVVNNQKTVGTGACAGCTEPICIVLNTIKVTTPVAANDVSLGNGATPGSNIATWQGTGPNCQLVPTKNATWGQVKSLYR